MNQVCDGGKDSRYDLCTDLYEDRLAVSVKEYLTSDLRRSCPVNPCTGIPMGNFANDGNMVCAPESDNGSHLAEPTRWRGRINLPNQVFHGPPSLDKINTNAGMEIRPMISNEPKRINNLQGTIEGGSIIDRTVGTPALAGIMNTVKNPLNYIYDYSSVTSDRINNRTETTYIN